MDSQQGRGEGLPTGPCSGLSKALHTLQAEPAANSALLGPLLLLPPAQLSGVSIPGIPWTPLLLLQQSSLGFPPLGSLGSACPAQVENTLLKAQLLLHHALENRRASRHRVSYKSMLTFCFPFISLREH